MHPRVSATVTVARSEFDRVLETLRAGGFTLFGPVAANGRVEIAEIDESGRFPAGWRDERYPGRYRLEASERGEWFGYASTADSWKRLLVPPRLPLFTTRRAEGGWETEVPPEPNRRWAFIGIRPCDVAAIGLHDRVFLESAVSDPHYAARRSDLFLLVAQCAFPSGDCFCSSLGTGPVATRGFDLALTELGDTLLLEVGSEAGAAALDAAAWEPATAWEIERAEKIHERAEHAMTRRIDLDGLPETLFENLEHPRWNDVANRCLSCGNCTMICPTCFCSTVEDEIEPAMRCTRRVRVWDSCYASAFSHVHGGNIRPSVRSRYRQWLTHKFASWPTQFGSPGCVGCGRCITFCPVGIDLTEEVRAIRAGGKR